MKIIIKQVDAFTETPLTGNPAGVVVGAEGLSERQMQMIAREMSVPETAFILPPTVPGAHLRIRWFTPMVEVPLCGHATVASGHALQEAGRFTVPRLTFETLELPPLRQRDRDVELLARHFLDEFSLELPSLGQKTLSPAALAALRTHRFPGNVRELKNVIERAAYRSAAAAILPADLGLTAPDDLAGQTGTFEERTTLFARRLLAEALSQADGNQAAAARSLGLSYHQFRYFLKKHGLGAKRSVAPDEA